MQELEKKYSLDMEFALIGWVLSQNELMNQLSITGSDFESPVHGEIWNIIRHLHDKGESISPFTIKPNISDESAYSFTGGVINYLSGSISHAIAYPWPLDIEKSLIAMSQKRMLVDELGCLSDDNASPIELASRIQSVVDKVVNTRPTAEFFTNKQVSENIIASMVRNEKPQSTGIAILDTAMDGGLFKGKAYGFCAKKKHGKTILGGTISHNLNMLGVKHLFICGEMSKEEVHQRTLARALDCYPSTFYSDYGRTKHFIDRMTTYNSIAPNNVLYKDAPALTFGELKNIVSMAVERHGIKGFILDYWQLVGGKESRKSTAEHLDEVAQWIADYSRKKGVWSITMAQINQEGNTRGGEGLRLAFDQVYQIHRPDLGSGYAWMEMMDTRYTQWQNIGSEEDCRLILNEKGLFFEEMKR